MRITDLISPPEEKQIVLHSAGRIRLVQEYEVIFVRSDNNYSIVHLMDNSEYFMCKTLKEYEAMLDERVFVRCHRSYLVNQLYIKEIFGKDKNRLLLLNGSTVPVSRRRLPGIKKLILQ